MKKTYKLLLIASILLTSSALYAQEYLQKSATDTAKTVQGSKQHLLKELADVYFSSGNYMQAVSEYAFLLSNYTWPKKVNVEILSKQGFAYAALKQYDHALETFQECIEIDKNNWEHYLNIAKVYNSAGLAEEAILHYKKVIALDGDKFSSRIALGELYQSVGFNTEAIENYKQALLIKSNAKIYRNLSKCYELLHKLDLSSSMLKQAISLEPDIIEDYIHLAWLYYVQDKYDQAIESLRFAQGKVPGRKEIELHLVLAYFKKGEFDTANTLTRKLLADYPDDALVYFVAGTISYLQKGYLPAKIYFNKSRDLAESPLLKEYSEYFVKNLDTKPEKK